MNPSPKARPDETAVRLAAAAALALAPFLFGATAEAGRGSSLPAMKSAVESGSVDAISSELERAEHFVCPACVPVVRPLVDHADERVRRVAVWWLARRGLRSELAIEAFERLAQPDSRRARNAADVLGALRSELAIAPLGAALQNPVYDADARAAMARALGRIGLVEAAPALRKALGAPEAEVRAAAVATLRELDGFDDVTAVLPALRDGDAGVRGEAIYTLGSLRRRAPGGRDGDTAARALAALVTSDPSADVRRRAAWALGEAAAPAAIAAPALEQAAARDASPLVRSVAAAAVGRLAR